jgi:hypothetical protein
MKVLFSTTGFRLEFIPRKVGAGMKKGGCLKFVSPAKAGDQSRVSDREAIKSIVSILITDSLVRMVTGTCPVPPKRDRRGPCLPAGPEPSMVQGRQEGAQQYERNLLFRKPRPVGGELHSSYSFHEWSLSSQVSLSLQVDHQDGDGGRGDAGYS